MKSYIENELKRNTIQKNISQGIEPRQAIAVPLYFILQSQMLRLGVTGAVRSEFARCSYGRRRIARSP